MKHGVTIGKFWPFHLGHDLMIKAAMTALDRMTVVISSDAEWKNDVIEHQMICRYDTLIEFHMINFVKIVDDAVIEKDADGTALDDSYIEEWADKIKALGNFTHMVTSDKYGKYLAEKMDIDWLPIDPDRECIPISGTDIREAPDWNWMYLTDEAKHYWATRIAVVGPESVGKSTMVKAIGLEGNENVATCPEWGRTISEAKGNFLTIEDFKHISLVQNMMMDQAAQIAPIVLSDTDPMITSLYADTYLSNEDATKFKKWNDEQIKMAGIHYYLVLAPTVPWVNDGWRVMPDQEERQKFFDDICSKLDEMNADYDIINATTWEARHEQAMKLIDSHNRVFGEPTAKEFSNDT